MKTKTAFAADNDIFDIDVGHLTPENRNEIAKKVLNSLRSYDDSKNTDTSGLEMLLAGAAASIPVLPYLDDRINKLNTTDLKSLAAKALVGGLLGGGAGAVGTEARPGETGEQKRKRLIRNSLLGAAGGAGLGALSEVKMGTASLENISNIQPDADDSILETFLKTKAKRLSDIFKGVKETAAEVSAIPENIQNQLNEKEKKEWLINHAAETVPKLENEIQNLQTTNLKNLATKALVGGILGGGVGTASTGEVQGENRQQRRKRLLRNALLGVAGGAGLGALSEVKMGSHNKLALAEALNKVNWSDPALIAGLGSAGVAGLLTALKEKQNKNKSFGRKTLSVLGNAALAGALGAGSASLLGKSKQQLVEALPVEDIDPVTQILRKPQTAALSGLAGLGIGSKLTEHIQPLRAAAEIRNYATSLADSSFKQNIIKALEKDNIPLATSYIASAFPANNAVTFARNLARNSGQFRNDAKALNSFLRYININRPGLGEKVLGMLERGIDFRNVSGAPGGIGPFRGVGGALTGAAIGAALPYLITKGNEYIQNRQSQN